MSDTTTVTNLRCEYLVDPVGIDEQLPRLSWNIESSRRGARQVAYQIRVTSSLEQLGAAEADLWDSGRVESDTTTHIEYFGVPLRSRMECHWNVTVWDETGASVTSDPASWTMGLLDPSDWHARWIAQDPEIIRRDPDAIEGTDTEPGTPPLFRKSFEVPGEIRQARLYATARGILDVSLNGATVTEDKFLPEWTDYHKRLHYRTFDVTRMVQVGPNAIGAILGDGWWSGYIGWQEMRGQYGTLQNSLLVQLEVELATGERLTVVSDGSWRCETGPILQSDFMLGEHYDARRERLGWDGPGFDDGTWLPALEVEPPCVRTPHFGFSSNEYSVSEQPLPLVAQKSEPVRVVEEIRPESVNEVEPGVFIYDLGQNIAGWVELTVSGAAGTRVQLRHGERLTPDGTLYTENLRRADATDVYILRGDGKETWSPRFTFHGFQYIEITGLDVPIPLEDICGCVVMSGTKQVGEFECSDPMVNRLWKNALWGQKGNFLTVPTDCPQRDERLGWMGDAQVFLRSAMHNMDVAAFFTKWITDVIDSQDVDGVFPDVAPRIDEGERFVGLDGLGGAAAWADAGIIVPWTMWKVYGDQRIVERCWDAMAKWLDWIEANNPDGIRSEKLGNNYGDWLCIPSDTSFRTHSEMKTLLATAFWADDAMKMAEMAELLGKSEECKRFRAMAESVRSSFREQFATEEGEITVETQTANLLALAFDLIPEEHRQQTIDKLVSLIEREDWHLSTGFVGIRFLNPILTEQGRADVAYRLLNNRDYPSWLYPVVHGATTIWERWNGWTADEGFFNPQMNSFNHYSLGSVCEWLYRHVAGIELHDHSPGYKEFVIKPYPNPLLSFAKASYRSIQGVIESGWNLDEDALRLNVTIPANTEATVYVPCSKEAEVLIDGEPAVSSTVIKQLGYEQGYSRFEVPAGKYVFSTAR